MVHLHAIETVHCQLTSAGSAKLVLLSEGVAEQ